VASGFESDYVDVAGVPTLDRRAGTFRSSLLQEIKDLNDLPVMVDRSNGLVIPWGGTFSNKELLVAIELGHIMQHPHDPTLVDQNGVDFRLGHYFYKISGAVDADGESTTLYNAYDPVAVDAHFGEVLEAQPLKDQGYLRRRLGVSALKNIDPELPVIILRPGERILGHTLDFMGISPPGGGQVFAASTLARNGITIAQDSTGLKPGWKDRLTLEIKNEDNENHYVLPVGSHVGHTIYHSTGPVAGTYGDSGSYNGNSSSHEAIVASWVPERMKPKVKTLSHPPTVEGLAEGLK
jgi:deoxycytidine triphosphate deaminase